MAETSYKVIWQRGPAYAVEITEPDGERRIVSPFEREADAYARAAEAKWKAALDTNKANIVAPKKPD
ncbi:MAG: hypothetical protein ACRD4Y_00405 [Candidatus Acidiferrales bacterium]